MIMKGQKRRFPPEDVEVLDSSSPSWESQRQYVFSVSLSKYQRGQELPEPSLRRSVLIANTLRQMNSESCGAPSVDQEASPCSRKESVSPGVSSTKQASVPEVNHSALPSCSEMSSVLSLHSATSLTSCLSNTSSVPMFVGEEDGDWGSMSMDPDFSLSAAISSILSALDSSMDGNQQASQRTPLRSLENLSRSSEGNVAWLKQGVRGYGGIWEQLGNAGTREAEAARSSSYLSDFSMEDLFQDIDTSLLEKDMGLLGLRGSVSGFSAGDELLRYLPPFSPSSLALNQNLKSLPSFSSFSPLSSASSPSLPPSPSFLFSAQNHGRDGLELEHLMEILVES